VDREGVLAFADELAREIGWWLLASTGASDVHEAERLLWEQGRIDDLAVTWALAMQARDLRSREGQGRLSAGIPEHPPRYLQPEEAQLLLAHVAWRLDLDAVLIRSPVHWYLELREPGGDRRRGVEATCFWRVDALGRDVHSPEPSVGRRLVFPPDHYPSGVGGIRNPSPLPPGAYEPIGAAELTGELTAKLALRYDADPAELEARLATEPGAALAQTVYRTRLAAGIAAWERGDLARVRAEAQALQTLRTKHGALLAAAPDELVLDAIVRLADGDRDGGLAQVRKVLEVHEPNGPVMFAGGDAHATAMWLELEHGRASPEDWNRRIVPLLNRHKDDPARMSRLCELGRAVLASTTTSVEELVPECR
jgi:hypothetical protein